MKVWVVDVNPDEAKKRLMARNNISAEEAVKRIQAQMPREERLKAASVVIDNSGWSRLARAI
jgi:dephospho-CoA kinase